MRRNDPGLSAGRARSDRGTTARAGSATPLGRRPKPTPGAPTAKPGTPLTNAKPANPSPPISKSPTSKSPSPNEPSPNEPSPNEPERDGPSPNEPERDRSSPNEPERDRSSPNEPGRDGRPPAGTPRWRPGEIDPSELHRGVLTSGAADQLAALVARAAHAPAGLIHFVQGQRLRLYGGWGLTIPWDTVADTPVDDALAGIVLRTDGPLVIGDIAADPRVPAGWPPCSASAAPSTRSPGSGRPPRSRRSPRPPR
jgi:hypothetical protein